MGGTIGVCVIAGGMTAGGAAGAVVAGAVVAGGRAAGAGAIVGTFGGGALGCALAGEAFVATVVVPGTSAGAKPMFPATSLICIRSSTVAGVPGAKRFSPVSDGFSGTAVH
jgi:hypothetical protein